MEIMRDHNDMTIKDQGANPLPRHASRLSLGALDNSEASQLHGTVAWTIGRSMELSDLMPNRDFPIKGANVFGDRSAMSDATNG